VLDPWTFQLVASRYTDCTILAHVDMFHTIVQGTSKAAPL
jgi:hypothetical protein